MVVIPLGAAFALPLLARGRPWMADLVGNAAMAALLALAVATLGVNGQYQVGGWGPGLGILLRVDGLTTLMLMISIPFLIRMVPGEPVEEAG